ncbi:hypothetical protein FHS21_004980 [Phyllobacterium trifolii]|uniref:Pyridoxamine 5'-phosphate oxidase N-terminal domain-containing protein n=1 Tax=Phyllobacterium trifolii TaxID=300193 RepID=A0A839UID4_9HYPH|nr:pyridoxamine 5'-phosphate oxidase family protein [Phyllobacterium trifolii]MBB3148532.1 hypothetical protein [Phyllobacterium trifolii]
MSTNSNLSLKSANIEPDLALGHPGELAMRAIFPSPIDWKEENLKGMMRDSISVGFAAFINSQHFFFLATSSAKGHCDASFKAREYNAAGEPLPAVLVIDAQHVAFPDYAGNGLYNSLGNIAENPHVGMLFVDFEHQRRGRLNGKAEIVSASDELRRIWPMAQSVVLVTVEQAFGNCPARIPQMHMEQGSDRSKA